MTKLGFFAQRGSLVCAFWQLHKQMARRMDGTQKWGTKVCCDMAFDCDCVSAKLETRECIVNVKSMSHLFQKKSDTNK